MSKQKGGSAYYFSIGAFRYPTILGIVSCLNVHDKCFKDFFKNMNFPTGGIVPSSKHTSLFTVSYPSVEPGESRDVTIDLGCGEDISFTNCPRTYLTAAYFHICTAHPIDQLKWIREIKSQAKESFISIDTVTLFIKTDKTKVLEAFSYADLLFMNEEEKELLFPEGFPTDKIIVLKKGEKGAEIYYNNLCLCSIAAPKVTEVDATGAGDILAGAFISSLAMGNSLKISLLYAVSIASESVKFVNYKPKQ
jgi:sugar/nucleoside kinase (ribokinase family)